MRLKPCLHEAKEILFAERYFVSLIFARNFELFAENFVSLKFCLKKLKRTRGIQNFLRVNQLYEQMTFPKTTRCFPSKANSKTGKQCNKKLQKVNNAKPSNRIVGIVTSIGMLHKKVSPSIEKITYSASSPLYKVTLSTSPLSLIVK